VAIYQKIRACGAKATGKHKKVVEWIFYVCKTGCQWRMIHPSGFSWQLVYYYFRKWIKDGSFEKIHQALIQWENKQVNSKQTVGIIDSQSVRMSNQKGLRGIDGHKHVNGRKRHVVVNNRGRILGVCVTQANKHDSKAARVLLKKVCSTYKSLKQVYADKAYRGPLVRWLMFMFVCKLIIVVNLFSRSFKIVKKRWIVERAFAWFNGYRRLAKDYEVLTATAEAFIIIHTIQLILKKL
jgi:putative transposase